jgi:uncharacterized protein YtpQ (UPF0354 family)
MNLADQSAKTVEKIVPRIYVALPRTGEAGTTLSPENSPVQRRLVADLVIFYAFDVGAHYEIVSNKDLTRLDITPDELHDRALTNLRELKLEVRAHKGERTLMLTAGGNYEATLVLLPEVWGSVSPMVSGQIVALVPARDVLLFTGDADPENLADMRRLTSKTLEHADKPLSRVFIRWMENQWEEYTGYAE